MLFLPFSALELGGSLAAIVLDDADLASTLEGLKFIGLMNSGQACVAQTRVLVSRDRHDEVSQALADAVAGMQVGDPMDPATEIGPMVAQRQQERVETSRSARRRAPSSSPAAPAGRTGSTTAGTSGPRSSQASTTGCGSPRRRSSVRRPR